MKYSVKDMLVNLSQNFFGGKNAFENYSLHKIGTVDIKLVNRKVKKILLIEKLKKKINIKQIGKKIFLLNYK